MRIRKLCFVTLICLPLFSVQAQNYGSVGCVPDPACFDSNHSDIELWATAGVTGGIPVIALTKDTLNPGENIQEAIDNGGAGIVLLRNGTYPISNSLYLRNGIVLRGESRAGVKISVDMQGGDAIIFDQTVSNAGLENLRVVYEALPEPPKAYRSGMEDGGWCDECFQNDFPGNDNSLIHIEGDNNWVDSVDAINSGSDPIEIYGEHNTFRNSLVDNCYNKGGGGEGYFDLKGHYNLVTGCTVRLIRHFAIQNGASYNVVVNNRLEVDVNFHNGDDGHHLIEGNELIRPSWHTWGVFATGGAAWGHEKPGPGTVIFNNTSYDYREKRVEFAGAETVYTYTDYGEPSATTWPIPKCETFYAVRCGPVVPVAGISVSPADSTVEVFQTIQLFPTVSPTDATYKAVTWSSDNDSVAFVNAKGEVSGIAQGTAIITAMTTDGSFTDSCTIIVLPETTIGNVALNKSATASASDGNIPAGAFDGNTDTRWSAETFPQWIEVDLGSIKTISSTEVVCFQDRAYQYIVEAKTSAEDSYTQIIDRSANTLAGTVTSPIVDNFKKINARYLRMTVTGASGYSGSWASIIEIRIFGFSLGAKVTEIPVDSVSITPSQLSLEEGGSSSLSVMVFPDTATYKAALWSSSDNSVATVTDGLVHAIGEGKAIITVKTIEGSDSAACNVEVSAVTVPPLPPTGFIETFEQEQVSCYPNPFTSSINVVLKGKYNQAQLINLTGKVVVSENVSGQNQVILRPGYESAPAGLYFLHLLGERDVKIYRLIRE